MREEQEIGGEEERGNRRESTGEKEKSTGKTRITIPFKNHSSLPLPPCPGLPRVSPLTLPLPPPLMTVRDSGRPFPAPTPTSLSSHLTSATLEGQHLQNSGVYNNYYCPRRPSPLPSSPLDASRPSVPRSTAAVAWSPLQPPWTGWSMVHAYPASPASE